MKTTDAPTQAPPPLAPLRTYNPDVLSCIANLSNDEVFTPPDLANRMLDLLPVELFSDPATTFLDPACKSGVFLREIAKRLVKGLASRIPDLQTRLDHIFRKQLFGLAITELTSLLSRRSLYCSKYPNGKYSVVRFPDEQGNVRFGRIEHDWQGGKCRFCGASQSQWDRGDALETHAYSFLHADRPEDLFRMKFDVIISNPPYQLDDGGAQASASPIYQLFVQQAMKLQPRYLSMIIPARWYSGGKGLDEFREEMISNERIRVLHDFTNAKDCFGNGVEIKGGICYFLYDSANPGPCHVVNHSGNGEETAMDRPMRVEGTDVFVRQNSAIGILEKIRTKGEQTFDSFVSSRKPFGLDTVVDSHPRQNAGDIAVYVRGGQEFIARKAIPRNDSWIDQFKLFISKAYGASDEFPHQILNRPIFGEKGTCCSETYLVIGPFKTRRETENVLSYISTRFFRFLVCLKKISQDATSKVYSFVPVQDFSKPWTDAELYRKYKLDKNEIAFIESMIKPME
jgi:site-specific DNA-methyltransferase (adenine-specific)